MEEQKAVTRRTSEHDAAKLIYPKYQTMVFFLFFTPFLKHPKVKKNVTVKPACFTFRWSRMRGTCTSISDTCASAFLKRAKTSKKKGALAPVILKC